MTNLLLFILLLAGAANSPEERIVQYLREHVKPGEPLIVSDLYNNVFRSPEERKVLDRLFNSFFKIPIFVAQYKANTGVIPTLDDISRQFNFPVEGEAAIILSIMDNDPRVPKFITRDRNTGEITAVDVEAIRKDPRFGKALERTLAGLQGKEAPSFSLDMVEGGKISSNDLKGRNYLLYFWFSGCPPCMKIAPELVQLQHRFAARNFTIIAVNADRFLELDTTDEQRASYVKKVGFDFPVAHLSRNMQEDYGIVNVFPTMFLVDAGGTIRKQYVSYQAPDTLAKDLEALLQ